MPSLLLLLSIIAGAPPAVEGALPCRGRDAAGAVRKIARADQRDRKNWNAEGMADRDRARLAAIRELLEAGQICKPKTAFAAGIVLQHSSKRADFALAHRLFGWAANRGVRYAGAWSGRAWDRYLVSGGALQWYGSQVQGQHAEDGSFLFQCLVDVDPAATDAEREGLGLPELEARIATVYAANGVEPPKELTLARLRDDGFVCDPFPWGE